MYENVIESYVEDIYTGVIEDYTIATVKVITQFSVAKVTLESQMSVRLSVCPSQKPLSLSELLLSAIEPI